METATNTHNIKKLLVLVSGNGTNLQTIIDCCQLGVLPCVVSHVLSNRLGRLRKSESQKYECPFFCTRI